MRYEFILEFYMESKLICVNAGVFVHDGTIMGKGLNAIELCSTRNQENFYRE